MPTESTVNGLLAGLIDLADPGRPPHPGGALCVPACIASAQDAPTTVPTATRGAQP